MTNKNTNLTQEELSLTKKLFLTSTKNYFHKPEQLKILESTYLKIINRNLKEDWEELSNLLFKKEYLEKNI